jgi:hypothetical protein
VPDREQKGGIVRFLRRLLQRPLPNAKPAEHPSVFIYDLRAEFPVPLGFLSHTCQALHAATYSGEPDAVLGVVRVPNPISPSLKNSLFIINLRKLPHTLLRERGLLHLVE